MRSALLASLLLGACSDAPSAGRTEAPRSGEASDLRAIGYADWDAGADEELAGVVRHDSARAWQGVNLFADDVSRCIALDMDGAVVHEWVVPGHDQVEVFALLDGGRVAAVSVDQGVTLLERDSTVVWQRALAAHHDIAALAGGGFLVPTHVERDYRGRRVRFDVLVELDAGGAVVDRWDTWEHREELVPAGSRSVLDEPAGETNEAVYDYFHMNAVSLLPGGDLLVCLRNTNTIVALGRESRAPLWLWGAGVLDFPHTPSVTPEGRLLVFDNGRQRGWSRVIEVDRETDEIVWSYRGDPPGSFFSDVRGACQRLPNGNTLVTESERGRAFEVTAGGEIVWEFYNPDLRAGERKRIYRVQRVPAER